MCNLLSVVLVGVALLQNPSSQTSPNAPPANDRSQAANQASIDRITREVHHELALLPYYGVFDNLAYRVSPDGTVTLIGQVVRPTLKSDAENVVKRIEGVEPRG
jgi:hyperosmotically inducible periplasmic protein